jgi:hypothetical protein
VVRSTAAVTLAASVDGSLIRFISPYLMISLLRASIRMAGRVIWAITLLLLCLVTIWAAAALYFDLPSIFAPQPAGGDLLPGDRHRRLIRLQVQLGLAGARFCFCLPELCFGGVPLNRRTTVTGNPTWQRQPGRSETKIKSLFITCETSNTRRDGRPCLDGKQKSWTLASCREWICLLTFGVQLLSAIQLSVSNSGLTITWHFRLRPG